MSLKTFEWRLENACLFGNNVFGHQKVKYYTLLKSSQNIEESIPFNHSFLFFIIATRLSFTMESMLFFSFTLALDGLFMSSPLASPGRKSKANWEPRSVKRASWDALATSHPHFVLVPAPPLSVLRRGLEAASWLVRKAPSFSLQESLEDVCGTKVFHTPRL